MAEKIRNLKLVSTETEIAAEGGSKREAFNLLALGELSAVERNLIEQLVQEVSPRAGIIAVARTRQSWDLRPVIMKVGEANPSVIRLCGPLGGAAHDSLLRLQSSFERMQLGAVSSGAKAVLDWGTYQGQLWYRRELYHATLAHQLHSQRTFNAQAILTTTANLIEQVISLHAYGVVHGHVATTNIAVDEHLNLSLFDVGVARFRLENNFETDYSVAPELLATAASVQASADVYGVALVCKRLILKAQRNNFEASAQDQLVLDALNERLEPMLHPNPESRPQLHDVLLAVRQLRIGYEGQPGPVVEPERAGEPQRALLPQHAAEAIAAEMPRSAKTHQAVAERKSVWWVYCIAALSLAFCAFTVHQRYFVEEPAPEFYPNELRMAWSSGLPSQMEPVVRIAAAHPRSFAEQLVVRSALRGENLPRGINADLLRIAFDSRWESSLSDSDRAAALLLATAGFVQHEDTSAVRNLSEKHAGLLLAVVASAPKEAMGSLKSISAKGLSQLPGSMGQAFQALLAGSAKSDCADPAIVGLARFAAFGLSRPSESVLYLETDFARRVEALSALFASNETAAAVVVDSLLNHPSKEFEEPSILWAKQWNLGHWNATNVVKLQLLAGLPPAGFKDPSQIGTLFNHPSERIRRYAVLEARDRISFSHPASVKVLSMLADRPELLTPAQLMQLAKILENPDSVEASELASWTGENPSQEILTELLLATASAKQATEVDTFIAMQLKNQGWKPTIDALKILRRHPDDYTRMMSYQMLFTIASEQSFAMLQESARDEKNKLFIEQLGSMLEQLHSRLNQ